MALPHPHFTNEFKINDWNYDAMGYLIKKHNTHNSDFDHNFLYDLR